MEATIPHIPGVMSRGKRVGGTTTLVMGILNVTPDSFSDGGKWFEPKSALSRAMQMTREGASIVDVGGESTRPGAKRVSAEEEWERIRDVVGALALEGVTVSVDTVNADTARKAADAGAAIINDVSGGTYDPEMARTCAQAGVAMVVQHWRGFPSDPGLDHHYEDPVRDVISEMMTQVDRVRECGLPPTSIVVDPGLGFALRTKESWAIVNSVESVAQLGYPLLIGASRKRFVRERYGNDLLQGSLDVTAAAVKAGAWGVRVHDVAETVELIQRLGSK